MPSLSDAHGHGLDSQCLEHGSRRMFRFDYDIIASINFLVYGVDVADRRVISLFY